MICSTAASHSVPAEVKPETTSLSGCFAAKRESAQRSTVALRFLLSSRRSLTGRLWLALGGSIDRGAGTALSASSAGRVCTYSSSSST